MPGNGTSALLVSRPVTLLMLFLTLLGTGVMAYRKTPVTFLPEGFEGETISVWLPYPGAGPVEVQDRLSRPVEEALRTIPGIREINSYSSEGSARLRVRFSGDADLDLAYGDVRDRIERLRAQLPDEMDRYRIFRWDSSQMPISWVGILYDDEAEDPFGPIENIALPRLEGVDGVAQARLWGMIDDAVRIFVDMEKVRGYGIDLGNVIRQMGQDNFTLPAGQVDDGGRTFAVRIDTRFKALEDVQRYPVGNGLVLADIAEVVQGRAYRDNVWRINGFASMGMGINKESGKNTIETCTRVEEMIAELEQDPRLADYTFTIFWSQKEDIMWAIDGLKSTLMWGGMFAIVVLFLFLRDLRTTMIAAMAIPSSMLAALIAVYFSGQTLNIISLTGFTLAIGMLVDNTVVIIENIMSKRAQGLDRLAAAAEGAGEVGIAVLASTLTSIVVFVPLMFMDAGRSMQLMMSEIGLPITYSLVASLTIAIVFIPTFTSRLIRKQSRAREMSPGLLRRYRTGLSWVLRHRFASFVGILTLLGLTMGATADLPVTDSEQDQQGSVRLRVDMPPGYTLRDANGVFERLEEWCAENMEDIGFEWYAVDFDRRGGDIQFWPYEDLEDEKRENMSNAIRERLPEFPGVTLNIGWDWGEDIGDQGVTLELSGPDFGVLRSLAEEIKPRLEALEIDEGGERKKVFEQVRSEIDEEGLDEVHIVVDRDRTADLDINPETIRGMVAWGLGGQRLPDFQQGGRDVRVQIEYDVKEVESLEFLRNLGLWRDTGGMVPLATVADLQFDRAVETLVRRDGRMTLSMSAKPAVENLYAISRGLGDVMRNTPLPEGYEWNERGGREEFEADFTELIKALTLSVILIYIIMAILLESLLLPLAILLSIPLAFMGVIFALWVSSTPFDASVGIGMILLAGVVVNNAIVLLAHVQHLRGKGLSRVEALLQGGSHRLRPILMTALTTIFGLMPMAFPDLFPGNTDTSGYEKLALTVAGGLAFSTFFTLFVVPLAYTLMQDAEGKLKKLLPGQR